MKRLLVIPVLLLLLILLFPSLALMDTVNFNDLIFRNGVHYKKFTEVPFTGKVTGLEQGKMKDGKKDGPWVMYFDSGQLEYKGTYNNGKKEGPWVSYWDNGQLLSKGTYKNGKKEGPWVSFWSDGRLNQKGTYKNGKKVQ